MAKKLKFRKAKRNPWHAECYRAYISVLKCYDNLPAYYEISQRRDSNVYAFSFWHGNMGFDLGAASDKKDAVKLCQKEFDKLISENI